MFETPRRLFSGLDLGEGPVWLAERNALAFVDITGKRVYVLEEGAASPQVIRTSGPVGCVAPMANGNLLLAVRDTLVEFDWETGGQTPHLTLKQSPRLRFNDGKCDAAGRLWVGAMAKDQQRPEAKGGGSFTCVERGRVVYSQKGYTIPNGLAFRPDGSFYHTDTATGGIDLCTLSADKSTLARRRVVDIPAEDGVPDGFCADGEGNLWIALWGGGKVLCIRPETGERLHTLALPDRNVSCCCFGGRDLSTLYVTTARDAEGLGGHLYAVHTQARGESAFAYRKDG